VPFGDRIVSSLDYSSLIVGSNSRAFAVDPSRLKQQVIYFGVLGQVLQAVEEYFLPYVTRKFFSEAKRIAHTGDDSADDFDVEEQKVFLNKVRREIELPEYDIYEDYDEMVVQVSFRQAERLVWVYLAVVRCMAHNTPGLRHQ
jgi:anoctamin-10